MTDSVGQDLAVTGLAKAESLLDIGRPADALDLLATLPPLAAVSFLRSAALYELGDLAGAGREAERGLAQEPDSPWGLLVLAETLLARGRGTDAAEAARAALDSGGPSAYGLIVLSSAQRLQGVAAAAVVSALSALELAPQLPAAHAALSRARHDAGDLAGAEVAARQATALRPQDQDALACLAEHLERSYRLTEAQQVRLAAVGIRPGQDQVDALGQVSAAALPVVLALNVLCPLVWVAQLEGTAAESLAGTVVWVAFFSGCYLLLRRVVQRSLTGIQRRGLRPIRRRENRVLLLSAAPPVLLLLLWWTWQAVRGAGTWPTVMVGVLLAGAALLTAHRIAPLRIPRVDWGEVVGGLRRDSGWQAITARVREGRQAARLLREHSRDADPVDAPMFLRNARFVQHFLPPLLLAFVVGVNNTAAGVLLLPVAIVTDAVFTDLAWPRLAARYDGVWRLARFHLRVVDARTGRPPSVGRSACRGLLRFLLCPVEAPGAFRGRRQVRRTLHDRLTKTKVVRLP